MPDFPIPVSVITGFLGAGKTTLLNRLLKDPDLRDTAVIINEFGDVAIDHLLVEKSSDGVIQLADGCLCCTVRGELIDTLADLVDRLQTGRIEKLSRVVIETTGLADPAPVLQSIMAHPLMLNCYRLDGVITVVDALHADATLDAHVEAVKQVAVADRLVIAKADLVEDGNALADLRARLQALNPRAAMLDAGDPGASAAQLIQCGLYDPETKSADVRRWLGEEAVHAHRHHAHGDEGDHDHHHNGDDHHHNHHRHDERVKTLSLRHDKPLPFSAVATFLDLLISQHGERLLRMKGIIETSDKPATPLVVHAVQSLLHPPAWLPSWPDDQRGTRLVLIAIDLPEDYVRRLFAATVGTPAVDMPDRAALADNPLAVAGYRR
jgi:G3E family GTPase